MYWRRSGKQFEIPYNGQRSSLAFISTLLQLVNSKIYLQTPTKSYRSKTKKDFPSCAVNQLLLKRRMMDSPIKLEFILKTPNHSLVWCYNAKTTWLTQAFYKRKNMTDWFHKNLTEITKSKAQPIKLYGDGWLKHATTNDNSLFLFL